MATLVENKKASFDYEFLETFETGIELLGFEVKSLRNKRASLLGAHVIVRGGEVYVVGMKIDPYQPKNTIDTYDPLRTRKLLLSKKEIFLLSKKDAMKGLTLIPVSVYTKGPKVKIAVVLARGKKAFDKRDTIKKRDSDRDIRREMKLER